MYKQFVSNNTIQRYQSEAIQHRGDKTSEIHLNENLIEHEINMIHQHKLMNGESVDVETELIRSISFIPEQQHQIQQQKTEFYYTNDSEIIFRDQNFVYPSIYAATNIDNNLNYNAYSLPSINTVLE